MSDALIKPTEVTKLPSAKRKLWLAAKNGFNFTFLVNADNLDSGTIVLVGADQTKVYLQWCPTSSGEVLLCSCKRWVVGQCCEHVAYIVKCAKLHGENSYYTMFAESGLVVASAALKDRIVRNKGRLEERRQEVCPICYSVDHDTAHIICGQCDVHYCSGCLHAWHRVSGKKECPLCKSIFTDDEMVEVPPKPPCPSSPVETSESGAEGAELPTQ